MSPHKKPAAPVASSQNLSYLKAVPKRVDCWLSKDRKMSQTSRQHDLNSSINSGNKADLSKTTKILDKLSQNRYSEDIDNQNFEQAQKNREEFLLKFNTPQGSKNGKGFKKRKSKVALKGQNFMREGSPQIDLSHDISQEVPGQVYDPHQFLNPLGNGDDRLEILLERLEESRNVDKGFSLKERSMLMEDTEYMAMVSGSDTLFKIFQLMSTAQENYQKKTESLKKTNKSTPINESQEVIKMSYDLEFEKLLFMLKTQYHSLFKLRKLKKENNKDNDGTESVSDTDSENYKKDESISATESVKKPAQKYRQYKKTTLAERLAAKNNASGIYTPIAPAKAEESYERHLDFVDVPANPIDSEPREQQGEFNIFKLQLQQTRRSTHI